MMTKNGNQPVPFRFKQSNGLHGKVALIVCDQEEGVRSLVGSLARKGVDIALACVREPSKNVIKDEVEAQGRRFLAIRGRINSADVVQQIIQAFGHLDLFIDCSTTEKERGKQEGANGKIYHPQTATPEVEPFANTTLTRAALQALVS